MLIDLIKKALVGPLPGSEAQLLMAPSSRHTGIGESWQGNFRESSVLILFYPKDHIWHLPLIQRPVYNGVHSGQISLPGGKCEKQDAGYWETALREAGEEIGINPGDVTFLGKLTPLYIPKSNFYVFPQVGWLNYSPQLKPQPTEVDEIIEAPVNIFFDRQYRKTFSDNIRGTSLKAPYFDAGGRRIWGATAMIISELAESLQQIIAPPVTASHFYNDRNAQEYL